MPPQAAVVVATTLRIAARAQIFTDELVQDATVEIQGMSLTEFTHQIYS
jgi:hypothetical protein